MKEIDDLLECLSEVQDRTATVVDKLSQLLLLNGAAERVEKLNDTDRMRAQQYGYARGRCTLLAELVKVGVLLKPEHNPGPLPCDSCVAVAKQILPLPKDITDAASKENDAHSHDGHAGTTDTGNPDVLHNQQHSDVDGTDGAMYSELREVGEDSAGRSNVRRTTAVLRNHG